MAHYIVLWPHLQVRNTVRGFVPVIKRAPKKNFLRGKKGKEEWKQHP
jgi:hypothetical protein